MIKYLLQIHFIIFSLNIFAQNLEISNPNGGEFFTPLSHQLVYVNNVYVNNDLQYYDLYFSQDNGEEWVILSVNTYPNYSDDQYLGIEWITPDILSDSCLIKVVLNSDSSNYDVSDSCFTIGESTDFPTFNFPLSIGNKWFFHCNNYNPDKKTVLVVSKDTLMDDSQIYQQIDKYDFRDSSWNKTAGYLFLRKEPKKVYQYPGSIYFDSDWNETDWNDSMSIALHFKDIRVNYSPVFGEFRRTYNLRVFEWYDYRGFTDGLGFNPLHALTWNDYQCCSRYLIGCIIDGIVYGDTLENFVVGILEEPAQEILSELSLYQNYPNPFNPVTTIKYSISKSGFVSLIIYDVLGNEIKMLVNEQKHAGNYEVNVDGSNLSSGVYFYKMKCGSFTDTKKFILLR